MIKDIVPAIRKNQNNLFDWIFEQKYYYHCSSRLLLTSISNGIAHAFIEIIDKSPPTSDYQYLLNEAAKNGFYQLSKLIYEILSKKIQEENKNNDSSSSSIPDEIKKLRNRENKFSSLRFNVYLITHELGEIYYSKTYEDLTFSIKTPIYSEREQEIIMKICSLTTLTIKVI